MIFFPIKFAYLLKLDGRFQLNDLHRIRVIIVNAAAAANAALGADGEILTQRVGSAACGAIAAVRIEVDTIACRCY